MPNLFQTGNGANPAVVYFVLQVVTPDWFRTSLVSALSLMCNQENWSQVGDASTDFARDKSVEMLDSLVIGVNPFPIGMVHEYGGSVAPDGWLLCDGSQYNQSDYPALYAVIGEAFSPVTTAGKFNVPNMIGRSATGAGAGAGFATRAIGDMFGEETVTLSEAQMPIHSHTDLGHVHSEIVAVSSVVNGGLEAPAPSAFPAPSSTGAGFANIQTAGGSEAHNNLSPSIAMNKVIYTGVA